MKEKWEKDFNIKFRGDILLVHNGGGNSMEGFNYPIEENITEEIKSFIRSVFNWQYLKGRNITVNALRKVLSGKIDPDLINQIEEDLFNELRRQGQL